MSILNTIVLDKVKTNVFAIATAFIDNCPMTLADRLKQARAYAKISQEELADIIGSSVDLIRKLEQGNRKNTTFIIKIATACKVRPEWLDDGSGEMVDGLYVEGEKLKNAFVIMQSLPEYALDEAIERIAAVKKFCEMAETANTKK